MLYPKLFPRGLYNSCRFKPSFISRSPSSSVIRRYKSQMPAQTYKCEIDAEPLHRYQPGGYHPVRLGEALKDGRYKILHKLGWGSYSTTWAARDESNDQYVAIKIAVSDKDPSHETEFLQAVSTSHNNHPGWSYLNRMLDHFTLTGPNGAHLCLVLELTGPSVSDVVDSYYKDNRLPARFAKSFAKQALEGLDFLARHDIGHGDLHTRNLAITVPSLNRLDEGSFLERLGKHEMAPVKRVDNDPLAANIPPYLIRPASFRLKEVLTPSTSVKIIDFGEAFFNNKPPSTLHTPLPVRAPEVVFGDTLDRRVDLWSAGCLFFELITGQPPFDVSMLTPQILVQQMMDFATDDLPLRWRAKWEEMQKSLLEEDDSIGLEEWMQEVYFDLQKEEEFTSDDIAIACRLIGRMLKFEPSLRASPSEILGDPWWSK